MARGWERAKGHDVPHEQLQRVIVDSWLEGWNHGRRVWKRSRKGVGESSAAVPLEQLQRVGSRNFEEEKKSKRERKKELEKTRLCHTSSHVMTCVMLISHLYSIYHFSCYAYVTSPLDASLRMLHLCHTSAPRLTTCVKLMSHLCSIAHHACYVCVLSHFACYTYVIPPLHISLLVLRLCHSSS